MKKGTFIYLTSVKFWSLLPVIVLLNGGYSPKSDSERNKKKKITFTLISYSSFFSRDGGVVREMHPLVLLMSKTPSLSEKGR